MSAERPDDTGTELDRDLILPQGFDNQIYSLQRQINLSWQRLLILLRRMRVDYGLDDVPIDVSLIGHSVGAYIALEMVRKHHEELKSGIASVESFNIVSTMLLTPTIQDIAQSSSGRIATPILSTLPFFPALLQLGSSALTSTLPVSWFEGLVATVTGMKNPDALRTTIKFLQLSGAVKQALYMARCEMADIGVSDWEDEIWGAVDNVGAVDDDDGNTKWESPKHFFLFAKEDHWVAQSTRDAIEQSMEGKAVIIIDDGSLGLVHAWCLDQSRVVAEIVNKWLIDKD